MEVKLSPEVIARRQQKTAETIRRIAELTIEAHGLDCSVEEYIKRCQALHAQKSALKETH